MEEESIGEGSGLHYRGSGSGGAELNVLTLREYIWSVLVREQNGEAADGLVEIRSIGTCRLGPEGTELLRLFPQEDMDVLSEARERASKRHVP